METVQFYRAYPDATAPLRADSSALGTIPASAFQYCEAMRSASSFGWYVFPPIDIKLRWNGSDIFYFVNDEWAPLSVAQLPGITEYWDSCCPPGLRGLNPPFLTSVPVRGIVQIWSGLLLRTRSDWSALIRPLVNIPGSHLYSVYEGIIETDTYCPCPLFTNVQLIATDITIEISRVRPLFQVQPLIRQSYGKFAHTTGAIVDLRDPQESADTFTQADWDGYRRTIRTSAPDDPHSVGDYAVAVRKRNRKA